MKITLFAADSNENSLGRVYVIWLLARHLGWETDTISNLGTEVWKPLRDTEFGRSITSLNKISKSTLHEMVKSSDVLVGCKPRPESSGLAIKLGKRFKKPVMIDIDDPDLEFQFDFITPAQWVKRWLRPTRRIGYHRLRRTLHKYPVLVSNPVLQKKYGGWIVPHARENNHTVVRHTKKVPVVAFVGTVLPHKGIDDLRSALRLLQATGNFDFKMIVTASAPAGAEPWEEWVGVTSFGEGQRIVEEADIVVIPSRRGSWSDAQLPAKLMDAMLAGRAICVTNVGPLDWAVGSGAVVVEPQNVEALAGALAELMDAGIRQNLGENAQRRALEAFTVEAIAPIFQDAVMQALGTWNTLDQTLVEDMES